MQLLQRTALTAARSSRTTLSRTSRRFASDHHGHGQAHNVNESFGLGLWLPLAAFPFGYLLYKLSQSTQKNPSDVLSRLIKNYMEKEEDIRRSNALHTQLMEQAAKDRVLFYSSPTQVIPQLRFPEIMNNGSPFNVVAGSQVNMDKVIEKMQREAYEDNERKLEALRNNQIKSEIPIEQKAPRYRGTELKVAIG
ncbi:hypothetical protein M011DRAFT_437219 [Sporormia fimetaria CBS 119925]|uniref:Uncharacterized protein n=1 Tax=Sporormia fimetaria CBS 119925 TaxID=1340428 RepID=A0A6A6VMI0_9PLEO|nr:hypothetical protein M011DRAFT_437219 [Sporormia fimetaria CBS 119925]